MWLGVWKSQKKRVAIKRLREQSLTADSMKSLKSELSVMHHLQSKHIVTLLGGCFEAGNLCMVCEIAENGSVYDVLHSALNDKQLPFALRLRMVCVLDGVLISFCVCCVHVVCSDCGCVCHAVSRSCMRVVVSSPAQTANFASRHQKPKFSGQRRHASVVGRFWLGKSQDRNKNQNQKRRQCNNGYGSVDGTRIVQIQTVHCGVRAFGVFLWEVATRDVFCLFVVFFVLLILFRVISDVVFFLRVCRRRMLMCWPTV